MEIFTSFYAGKFSIITFEEFISIALDADRIVGIYPEMKNPVFINQRVSFIVCLSYNHFIASNIFFTFHVFNR